MSNEEKSYADFESNDAVDNALERLFDEPDVIPLRLTSSYRNGWIKAFKR